MVQIQNVFLTNVQVAKKKKKKKLLLVPCAEKVCKHVLYPKMLTGTFISREQDGESP